MYVTSKFSNKSFNPTLIIPPRHANHFWKVTSEICFYVSVECERRVFFFARGSKTGCLFSKSEMAEMKSKLLDYMIRWKIRKYFLLLDIPILLENFFNLLSRLDSLTILKSIYTFTVLLSYSLEGPLWFILYTTYLFLYVSYLIYNEFN